MTFTGFHPPQKTRTRETQYRQIVKVKTALRSFMMPVPCFKSLADNCLNGVVGGNDMSLVLRKPVFGVSNQVRHKLGCTATEVG